MSFTYTSNEDGFDDELDCVNFDSVINISIEPAIVHSNEEEYPDRSYNQKLHLPPDMLSGYRGHTGEISDYSSGSDYSPSTSFRSLSPGLPIDGRDLDTASPSPPQQALSNFSMYGEGQFSHSSELLPSYQGGLRHSRSSESIRSVGSTNTSASNLVLYMTPESSLSSSMERLGTYSDSLAIDSPQFQNATTPTSSSKSNVLSIADMLKLLVESGSSTASKDPDDIRKEFINQLMLSGHNSNDFSRPSKKEIGTAATLKASTSRRKCEATFVCELCAASFTRKNGVINHYRSHLGIADKRCMFCKRGFTTSLGRHIKKCKSNPDRRKEPVKKEML